jgi:hypothetical protein
VFAEVFRCWRPRVGIPHFDEDSGAVARQPQADRRLVASRRGLHGVGHQLADDQCAVLSQPVQPPLPQHVPGMQPGAGHRGRQSAEFEVTAQRKYRFVKMESRADAGTGLGTGGDLLWLLDDAGPAARGRGHRPLPPRTRSIHNAQAADLTEDAGTGVTHLARSHVHVRLATSLRRFAHSVLPTWWHHQ